MTTTANNNIALGNSIYRLSNTFSGQNNIGIGNDVFSISGGNLSGNYNIGIGTNTMRADGGIVGGNNIALGHQTMTTVGKIVGTDNIAIGNLVLASSGYDIGSYNIGIGNMALWSGMAKGNANIQIGNHNIGTPVTGELNNVVVIGNQITSLQISNADSNTILLGVESYNPNTPKVGVGTYQPKAKLDVAGDIRVGNENKSCTSANEGSIRYDRPSKKFQGCDGTNWINLH